MQVRLSPEVGQRVAELADASRRSASAMATVLIEEALERRDEERRDEGSSGGSSASADDTQKTPAKQSSGQPGRRTRSGRAAAAGRSDEIRTDFK